MDAYTGFAGFYDSFMDNVPYDKWVKDTVDTLNRYGVKDGLICDIGCGTGRVTRMLKEKGFDMIGIDNSSDMLEIAMYEHMEESEGILYLLQDMREFELYGTVNAFVSLCDSMNYLLSEEDIVKTLKLVNNYLEAGGLFVFDMKTCYEYEKKMGNRTIVDNREDATLIWENRFDPKTNINSYDITIYGLVDEEEGLFERFDETHLQRCYSADTMRQLIEKAGMEFVTCYDSETLKEVTAETERTVFVAREKKQDGKLYV